MNCYACNCRLNYLQLRQVFKGGLHEIECFNPECRKYNYLSRDGYFALKREMDLIGKFTPKITTKLPSEQKVLMISMERSGSSWVAAHISIEHWLIYGKLPLWNHECDRRYAVFKSIKNKDGVHEIVTPEGWNSVYDIDPKEALEKDFDKIILLEKPLEALKTDICKYNHPALWTLELETKENPDLLLDEEIRLKLDFFRRLRLKIEKWGDVMFKQEFNDPRVYKIKLDELNNFTEWEWLRFCDWFGFPERITRSHPFAVNRNWQVYSDVLPTNYPLCGRLRQLQEIHPNIMAQELIEEEFFFAKMKDEGKFTDGKEYPFVNKVNPYLRIPHETMPKESRSFRISESDGLIKEIKDVLELGEDVE